jgi:sulfur carrier protein
MLNLFQHHLIMKLIVNSEPQQFSGKNISELVVALNMINTNGTAFAVNEKVVPKTEWEKFELKDNDKILIIKATQGG